jgi:hypothetical protein
VPIEVPIETTTRSLFGTENRGARIRFFFTMAGGSVERKTSNQQFSHIANTLQSLPKLTTSVWATGA